MSSSLLQNPGDGALVTASSHITKACNMHKNNNKGHITAAPFAAASSHMDRYGGRTRLAESREVRRMERGIGISETPYEAGIQKQRIRNADSGVGNRIEWKIFAVHT